MLGLGELCFRKDSIGTMTFFNPMFVLSESFARSFGLHDRRPKTQITAVDSVEVNMPKVAQMTTDLVGELVGREVVENALLDVVDRVGEVCASKDYGIVVLDFGFGKLVCENKSVEFVFGDAPGTPTPHAPGCLRPGLAEPPVAACGRCDEAGREARLVGLCACDGTRAKHRRRAAGGRGSWVGRRRGPGHAEAHAAGRAVAAAAQASRQAAPQAFGG
jgi:hypothetical protein